jgi:hypothetical protein
MEMKSSSRWHLSRSDCEAEVQLGVNTEARSSSLCKSDEMSSAPRRVQHARVSGENCFDFSNSRAQSMVAQHPLNVTHAFH